MEYTLKVNERKEIGKSASKKIRNQGFIPAVVYGHGDEAVHLSVNEKEFTKLLDSIKGRNPIIDLQIENKTSIKAIIKSMQRAAVSKKLLSIDFQKIHTDEKISISIPIILKGTAIGIKEGGILDFPLRSVTVRGQIDKLPDHIEVDISHLRMGHSIHIADLNLKDIEFLVPADTPIVSVLTPKKVTEVTPTVTEEITEPEVITEKKREVEETEGEGEGKKKTASESDAKKETKK